MFGKLKPTKVGGLRTLERASQPAGGELVAPPDDVLAVLVVCGADTCRSPFVAAVLQQELDVVGVRARVSSAGIRVEPGSSYDDRIARLLGDRGLPAAARGPRPLDPLVLSTLGRDLVVVLSEEHLAGVAALDPGALPRTFPLRLLATLDPVPSWWQALDAHHARRDPARPWATHQVDDIPDPYGKQGADFVAAIEQLTVISMASARFIATA